jgi:hypothetical protein
MARENETTGGVVEKLDENMGFDRLKTANLSPLMTLPHLSLGVETGAEAAMSGSKFSLAWVAREASKAEIAGILIPRLQKACLRNQH